jgi:hypothetical protein
VDLADPGLWGKWHSVGVYRFEKGKAGSVTLTTDAGGNVDVEYDRQGDWCGNGIDSNGMKKPMR